MSEFGNEPALAKHDWRSLWSLDPEVTYLNHGSFGPSPIVVQEAFGEWTARLEREPMDFFLRTMEPALHDAIGILAGFVGSSSNSLVFIDNATAAMNIVAASVDLAAGDEVLVTDHEYGAVVRLWKRRCQQTGSRVVTATLPCPVADPAEVVDALFSAATSNTKLIVVSHVTSPTALILPVQEICRRARESGIPVCIDGPHAVNLVPLELRKLDCDFYTASLHKWLSAPFGSGFLFVHPRQQKKLQPAIVSWGGSIGGRQPRWQDEFVWQGTRNPAAFLAVPEAIRFFNATERSDSGRSRCVGDDFRSHAAGLLGRVRDLLGDFMETGLLCDDPARWCAAMISVQLPPIEPAPDPRKRDPLQDALWERCRIEIPIVHWQGRRLLRVSAHLYNDEADIAHLAESLRKLLPEFSNR